MTRVPDSEREESFEPELGEVRNGLEGGVDGLRVAHVGKGTFSLLSGRSKDQRQDGTERSVDQVLSKIVYSLK